MKYKTILPFIGEYMMVSIKGDKYGVIDRSAQVAILIIYDSISPIFRKHPDVWLAVEKDSECYYINQKGERILL